MIRTTGFAEEPKRQDWWGRLGSSFRDLKELSKKSSDSEVMAERRAQDLIAAYENAPEALAFLDSLLENRVLLQIIARSLDLDPRAEVTSLSSLWFVAEDEADYLFRGHACLPPRHDYHPLLRSLWDGRVSPVSLVMGVIARVPAARERLSKLKWELPDKDAPAEEFDNFLADLNEAAAGPGGLRVSA